MAKIRYLTTNVSTTRTDYKRGEKISEDHQDFAELKEFLVNSPLHNDEVGKSRLELENEELRKTNAEQTSVIADLTTQNEDLRKDNQQLSDDNADLATKLKELLEGDGEKKPNKRKKGDKGDSEDAGK